jgi:hypothetical protein
LLTLSLLVTVSATGESQPKRKGETPEQKAEKQTCVEAHVNGQALSREGKLGAARAQFITCGREACPGALRKDCVNWLAQANESQPSVVVEARDERGKQTTDVKVYIDGRLAAQALEGRSIEVDPGTHAFRYVSKKGSVIDEQVVVLEGQKNRKLVAVFPREPEPPKPFRTPTASWVLGGIGVGAVGNFVLWAAIGSSQESDLEQTCAPRCAQEDADAMRRSYLMADISIALALAAFGGAVVVALTQQDDGAPPQDTGGVALRAAIGPTGAALRGEF